MSEQSREQTSNSPIEVNVPANPTHRAEWFSLFTSFREERFFLLLAVFIGIFSGLAVICFRLAIDWTRIALLGPLPHAHSLRLLIVPTLVSLLVSALVIHIFPLVRGSGVNQTKAALYIYNGYIPFRTAVGKFITAALAIGAGHSLGPEDPSLQIGAAIASSLGRRLELSREKLRLLAPMGAAAGLAAAFNAPVSAVLFVIEEVIGRWSAGILGSVVLSAISSVVVVRWFLGSEPLFHIPAVEFVQPTELIAYAVLGIAGGIAAVIFAKSIGYLRPKLRDLPRYTQYFQSAVAGLMIGLIGYLGAPQIMGAGYNYMDQALHGRFPWRVLAILAGLKILSTTLSFVSGTPGGMFAPTLFIGAMLGGAVGGAEHYFYPHLSGSTATYALVGMGVLFAGFLRAPMTSVFMVLEVSGNYSIIIPVIVANTFAYFISRSLQPVPIFDLLTKQDGLILPSLEEQREQTILLVEDAMRTPLTPVLGSQDTVFQAATRIQDTPGENFIVQTPSGGWNIIARDRLKKLMGEGKQEITLVSVLPHQHIPHLHPDMPLEMALRYVSHFPLVPVVHRADLRKLVGVISREDIMKKYQLSTIDEEP
jgi:chloride channel protein, CIC family